MSVVAAAVRSCVAVLASSVLVVTMVSPAVAQGGAVSAVPVFGRVLGAPVSSAAPMVVPSELAGDYSERSDEVLVDAGVSAAPGVSLADQRALTRQVVDEGRVVSRSEFSTTYELDGRHALDPR
jgi:hypothetical protein